MSLTRNGIRIQKSKLLERQLKDMYNDLNVKPIVDPSFEKTEKDEGFKIYKEDEKYIYVPRYYLSYNKNEIKSKTSIFSFNGKLRSYQVPIIEICIKKIKENGGGIMNVPCGFGKTTMAIYIAHVLQAKTLILVHKSFLQDQWIERIKAFTNATTGIIRQSKVKTNADIVVGMVESISMKDYDEKIFSDFKLVIYDEVHHLGSRVFSRALLKTGATYTLGLSATPIRTDGLTKVIKWFVGDIIYKQEMKKDVNVIVKMFEYNTKLLCFKEKKRMFKGNVKTNIPLTINMLCKLQERTMHLINIIDNLRKNTNRKTIILSDRIDLLKQMKLVIDERIKDDVNNGFIEENECKTYYYIGELNQKQRKEAELNADILFATYSMAKEALDIERLNTIVLATPQKNIIQSIGRIMRKNAIDTGIKPLIIDFSDFLPIFKYHKFQREKIYNNNSYKISHCYFFADQFVDKKTYATLTYPDDDIIIDNDYDPNLINVLPDIDDDYDDEIVDEDIKKFKKFKKFEKLPVFDVANYSYDDD